ncbi:hypothetical protein [Aestuariibacter salexigens]|uniref:hypothetical protein n=1 Tax=Aestuariibacter salexigens TaxID=226010 RepID=UPI00041EB8D2|nr:hypothetical protein [Aestuariibacter salexigens]
MKLSSLTGIALAATLSTSASAKVDLNQLGKELEVMSSVVATSLKQSNERQPIRFRSIDSTYLANQGVVFEVATTGAGQGWTIDIPGLVMPVLAPKAPKTPLHIRTGDGEVLLDMDEHDWEDMFADLFAERQESVRENAERMRELRSRSRELAWEQREVERRKRDLEFEARNAEGERRKDIQQDLDELQSELSDLDKQRAELEAFANKIEQEQEQQRAEQREARQKQYGQFLAAFEASVGDMLCRFGAGLKSLPGDQNISFVLTDFVRNEEGDVADRVYVFRQSDVMACVQNKQSVEDLLTNVNSYTF